MSLEDLSEVITLKQNRQILIELKRKELYGKTTYILRSNYQWKKALVNP